MKRSGLAWLLLVGCGRVATAPTAELDTGDTTDSAGDVSQDTAPVPPDSARPDTSLVDSAIDAGEDCPDPSFPPRLDGCPCVPQKTGTCTHAIDGKMCFYPGFCPSEPLGFVCKLVRPKEGKPYMDWVGCPSDCKTEKCYSLPDAAPE